MALPVACRIPRAPGELLATHFDGSLCPGIIEAVRALGFEIRAGVHTGEVEADGARVRGVAVHLGARIAAEARASQVLVSSTVRDLTAGSGLTFEDAGEHRLKGFEQPWQLYVASTSANPATAPADEHG